MSTSKTFKIGMSTADKLYVTRLIQNLVFEAVSSQYSSSSTYDVGDVVNYDGKLYRCTTAVTVAEVFDSSKWEQITLQQEVDEAVNAVDNKLSKGDYDGTTGVGYSDVANNLIATKGLTANDDPMSYGMVGGAQKSAVGDGNATLNKLVCVDVVKNQYVNGLVETKTVNGVTFTNNGDGTMTINGTASDAIETALAADIIITRGHLFLLAFSDSYLDEGGSAGVFLGGFGSGSRIRKTGIYSVSGSGIWYNSLNFYCNSGATFSNKKIFLYFIDLTQRYGSNEVVNTIIGTGTDDEKLTRLLAFDPEILNDTDYDTGTLVPSKTAKLLSVGVNQWDEGLEIGQYNESTGAKQTNNNCLRSADFIEVKPNSQYYFYCDYMKSMAVSNAAVLFYDADFNYLAPAVSANHTTFTTPQNCRYVTFYLSSAYGTSYRDDICINISDANLNGKYYSSKRNPITLPNYEGHGILKVVDGKVVADGTELYPDGNSKKRYVIIDLGAMSGWSNNGSYWYNQTLVSQMKLVGYNDVCHLISEKYKADTQYNVLETRPDVNIIANASRDAGGLIVYTGDNTTPPSGYLAYELATEEDITTPVFQSTFPVEQGGTLQFLDDDDNPIAGLQGSEIFYQKNIKAFVEALGEATNWDPERIKRLGDLSFTPEYVDITLNPSFPDAYAKAQVYNASFTIVISTNVTGTPNGSITFQDSEIDLSNFQTNPADRLYDMDGKKVSEAPTTPDCSIAPFVGRSKNGTILWSLLHSGVNKVKIHIEEAVPLDSNGSGRLDCRTNMIL